MNILQIGKFYPIKGGVEKVMYDLTRGLSGRSLHCDMLCACARDEMPEGEEVILNDCGRVICRPSLLKLAATMICPSMIFWLRRHRKDYDIIHVHHPDPMACLALFLSGYRGPVVLHWHSDIVKQRTLMKFYRPLQSWLIRRADLILGTTPVYVEDSPWLKDVQDKVSYLPIGIEPLRVEPYSDTGEKMVFSLGRLVGYKGYEHLIDSACFLPEGYKVVIAGGGPLKEELENRIKSKGLEGKVSLLGFISDEEKDELFAKCSVFCLSSIWKSEAFAIVQVEAMSCGKPVVATRIAGSGVSWVNADGFSGLNVEPEDPRALADAIIKITSDPAVYRTFCGNARRRYLDTFTLDAMIDRCIGFYEGVLNENE